MAAADIFETEAGLHQSQQITNIGATGTGKMRVSVAGAASGAGEVFLTYIADEIA